MRTMETTAHTWLSRTSFGAAVCLFSSLFAAGVEATSLTFPSITRARADLAAERLYLEGRGFGSAPRVLLGAPAGAFDELPVLSSTTERIEAELPAGVEPGTYLVVVVRGLLVTSLGVTLGAEGVPGPPGAPGATGPPGEQGEQGEPGEKGETGPPGPKGLDWRGPWDAAATYSADDAVAYEGTSWVALQETIGIAPVAGSDWAILAAKGERGEQGPTGDQGPVGPHGIQGFPGSPGEKGEKGDQGDTGEPGPPGPRGLHWRGAWDPAVAYAVDDAVLHEGTSWLALEETIGISPAAGNDWAILSAKGEPGERGATGDQGPLGPQGMQGIPGPAGEKGEPGEKGDPGPAGTLPSVSCPADEALRGITANGAPICTAVVRSGFATEVVSDVRTDSGRFSAITTGADGLGLVGYYDATNGDLVVARCGDPFCATATRQVVDSEGDVGRFPSIARAGDGFGIVSYYDASQRELKVAHCHDLECENATITSLASASLDASTSVAVDAEGLAWIAAVDGNSLLILRCTDFSCTAAKGGANLEARSSVAPSVAPLPGEGVAVSYADSSGLRGTTCLASGLGIPECEDPGSVADLSFPTGTSMVVGTDGIPLVSYYNQQEQTLDVIRCSHSCNKDFATPIDDTPNPGDLSPSIRIGTDGLGIIAYYHPELRALKVAHCNNAACTSATVTTLEGGTGGPKDHDVGLSPSVTIGGDGLPLMSYYDATQGRLKVAHCADRACLVR